MNQTVEELDLNELKPTADMLQEMVKRQKAFRQRVNPLPEIDFSKPLSQVDLIHVEGWVKEYALCIMMEGAELMDWTRWKHWSNQLGNKQDVMPGSLEHIREMRIEIADLVCFILNAAFELGMDTEDIYNEHKAKVAVNHKRQDSGSY